MSCAPFPVKVAGNFSTPAPHLAMLSYFDSFKEVVNQLQVGHRMVWFSLQCSTLYIGRAMCRINMTHPISRGTKYMPEFGFLIAFSPSLLPETRKMEM